MNESNLGKAFLDGDEPIDFDMLTQRVLKRDRRRMWFLGIICVIAWMMVVMLPWSTLLPMTARLVKIQMLSAQSTTAPTAEEKEEQAQLMFQVLKNGTMATFFGSVASMFVAAICTVTLIILSRRATLRQVNARLMEISTQLKAMSAK